MSKGTELIATPKLAEMPNSFFKSAFLKGKKVEKQRNKDD